MRCQRLRFEQLESRLLLAADWTNATNAMDVNASGQVTALDVLLVVNDIRDCPTMRLCQTSRMKSPPS